MSRNSQDLIGFKDQLGRAELNQHEHLRPLLDDLDSARPVTSSSNKSPFSPFLHHHHSTKSNMHNSELYTLEAGDRAELSLNNLRSNQVVLPRLSLSQILAPESTR
jgi:hypothetical protein